MSRKSCWIGLAVLLVASCAYADLGQTWAFCVGNTVSQDDTGMGISFVTATNGADVSNTQTMFSWGGIAIQSDDVDATQTGTTGSLAGDGDVSQSLGGSGGQTIGDSFTQGMSLGAYQTIGATSGWISGSSGTQSTDVDQSQGTFSWSGASSQSQQVSLTQSGTVIGAFGGGGTITQGAYVSSSQIQY